MALEVHSMKEHLFTLLSKIQAIDGRLPGKVFPDRTAGVGGQHCPVSVRNYCAVSEGQNQVQIRNPDTRKPSRLKISDID